ncbi:MAG: alpha-1,4-glucan--maltose-1-phosphate maltosyltransferase, partial [Chloroflexi bacterium]|nr:alpha-1,4-glucan--maltose-1-phosphate maltosyltransferase [Chloroflexota bacterium]
LGTIDDFRRLVTVARDEHGLEVALDIAFQCSPDHPYVSEHPEWFRQRPDGSIQYAENPPKKYQDIYPFDFETEHWESLWQELRSVFQYWIEQGVRVFRVDNPHTKALGFWEWVITDLKSTHPDVIFLSEAFTRPKVMHRLAKAGFTQSYNYFPWRNTKWEITQYFQELALGETRDFFRPNLWPATPDILPEYLQTGGLPAFAIRLVLAATLGASYGIYGPAFELAERAPREPGGEEYLNSEKYELRTWDTASTDSLAPLITTVNRARRDHIALQQDDGLTFHPIDNEMLLCYSKTSRDQTDAILVVVNLDPQFVQSGWVDLQLKQLALDPTTPFQVHDLVTNARYQWNGHWNFVQLDPAVTPAHIFHISRHARTERDFDAFV